MEPDTGCSEKQYNRRKFQSTGSRGARHVVDFHQIDGVSGFNPRARVEPDVLGPRRVLQGRRFNPRARVEPDVVQETPKPNNEVSIHGLAWSPTSRTRNPEYQEWFQSTGSRGARLRRSAPRCSTHPFQSTGSRGARLNFNGISNSLTLRVSIHGLAWSPTRDREVIVAVDLFQSTGSRGARLPCRNEEVSFDSFQSTGSRGARPLEQI